MRSARSSRKHPNDTISNNSGLFIEHPVSTAGLAETGDYENDGNGIENPTHMAASGRPWAPSAGYR